MKMAFSLYALPFPNPQGQYNNKQTDSNWENLYNIILSDSNSSRLWKFIIFEKLLWPKEAKGNTFEEIQ